MTKKKETAVTVFKFNETLDNTDDLSYSLLRPFEKLVKRGSPIPNIAFIGLRANNELFSVGSLTFSEGKKLIFFPGLINGSLKGYFKNNKYTTIKPPKLIHHMSLEFNKKKSHFKGYNSQKIMDKTNVVELQKGLYHWFSMSINNPELFEKLKNIGISVSETDAQRRGDILTNAFSNVKHHQILEVYENEDINKTEILHLDFYIVENIKTLEELDNKNYNTSIYSPLWEPKKTMVRKHIIPFKGKNISIVINVSKFVPTKTITHSLYYFSPKIGKK